MKNNKYSSDSINVLTTILIGLFPEFKGVFAELSEDGIMITFQTVKSRLVNLLFPGQTKIKKSLYELLWKDIPLRLSHRRAGNASFTIIYVIGIMSVMLESPENIIDYLQKKYEEIQKPYNKNFADILADIEFMEKQSAEALANKLLTVVNSINNNTTTFKHILRIMG